MFHCQNFAIEIIAKGIIIIIAIIKTKDTIIAPIIVIINTITDFVRPSLVVSVNSLKIILIQ